jgi:DNA-binding IclR family transcriptional regulator
MTANGSAGNAIEKVLSVLEALADQERITELAETTGLPKSTVHRILQSLVGYGFATSDGSGGYLPGPRVLALAGKVMHRLDPARLANPALQSLRDRTGHTVHLALRNGDEAVYIEKLAGRKPYEIPSRVGQSLLLHCTAIGKAILATLADDEVAAICSRTGMPRRTANTLTTPAGLLTHLTEIRRRGYALDDEEDVEGMRCLGAAVTANNGQIVGAVSISTLIHELPLAETRAVGTEVLSTARDISTALGSAH